MTGYASTTVRLLAACVALSVLGGCEGPQQRARELAARRWNMARAEVKAKLASDQFQGGNVAAAAGELAEAYRLDPENPGLVPLRVRVLLAEGSIAQAEDLLEQTKLAGKPGAEIKYLLGVVRQQQQRWEEALAAFLRAAEIDDSEVAYVVAAAQAWLQLGQPREALGFLAEMSSRFGWTSGYQAALAECYEQVDNWSAAASAWQRVVCDEDADAGIRQRLAEALCRSRRYVEAIPVLTELLEDDEIGSSVRTRLTLAECYLTQGRSAAAREQAQMVLQQEQDNVPALRLLARSLGAEGEYRRALRVARRAVAADQGGITTLELAAALAWRAGDRDSAAATATHLLRLDAQNPVAQSILRRARVQSPENAPD